MKNCAQILDCLLRLSLRPDGSDFQHPELPGRSGIEIREALLEKTPLSLVIFSASDSSECFLEKLEAFPEEREAIARVLANAEAAGSVRFLDSGKVSFENAFEELICMLSETHPVLLISLNEFRLAEKSGNRPYLFLLLAGAQIEDEDRRRFLENWNRGPFLAVTRKNDIPAEDPKIPDEASVLRWLIESDEPFLKICNAGGEWLWAKNARYCASSDR